MTLFYKIVLLCLLILSAACNSDKAKSQSEQLIPLPNNVEVNSSDSFVFDNTVKIAVSNENDEQLQSIAKQIFVYVEKELSVAITQVYFDELEPSGKAILLQLTEPTEQKESYHLSITAQTITLSASSHHGLFNATQTLKQLLFIDKGNNTLSAVEIEDQPKLAYRGLMLDVSRHFFSVEQIKKTLDMMALYKFNTFHWHLTDDQGWRIEINQYPLLTTIGSYREQTVVDKNFDPYVGDNTPYDGFYSQDDIRDIVQYAKERYITVIPEIDMPGHMSAALAAYPELACNEGPFTVKTRWGTFNNILCPSETTFDFVEAVLAEVMALFPSEYIHIGGDEVNTIRWENSDVAQALMEQENLASESEIQGYFYERVNQFLLEHERKAIGWDEIQEKGISSKTTVMVWRNLENTYAAVENGHQAILTPKEFTYLNYYQSDQSSEPLAQCCLLPLQKVYEFEPRLDNLTEAQRALILGAQGNMWTEYIKTDAHLEYMLFPRLMALSEVLWTNKENKNWQNFQQKLPLHTKYLESLSYNFRELDE
ncbi:beta-N-acetylhexosaminidase [bacterium]|nr:beta-N-acetylhexosaminidase [bacterium]